MLPVGIGAVTKGVVVKKLGIASLVLAILVFFAIMMYGIREDARQQIIYRGRADKENGLSIKSNPYLEPYARELWRQGWREAKEISE